MQESRVEITQFAGWMIWLGLCLAVTASMRILFSLLGEEEMVMVFVVGPIPYLAAVVGGSLLEEGAARMAAVLAYSALLFSPILKLRPRTRDRLRRLLGRITLAHVILFIGSWLLCEGVFWYSMVGFSGLGN